MAMIELNLRPDERTLRNFGFIALAGFGFLALIAFKEWLVFSFGLGEARLPLTWSFLGLAGYATIASLTYPKANWPLYAGLTCVSFPIGLVVSFVIMTTLFYAIVAPVGLLLRAVGRDPMDRRFLPRVPSYWAQARPSRAKQAYFRQF
jgi:hypothetical protein